MIGEKQPDPDEFLVQIQKSDAKIYRGKLRIYLGACAGVGKTFAMLSAAHIVKKEGKNVLIGIIETHGWSETAALTAGLPVLTPHSVINQGATFDNFNLEAALRTHPDILLLDELAHTNAQGARHPKRWQDAEELLASGIDVWSTLNIQHLESLNEAVTRIPGTHVFDTVPDTLLNRADEVVMIDLPVDKLLNRLQARKIYATRPTENFFRIVSLAFSAIRSRFAPLSSLPSWVDDDESGFSSYLPYIWVILACALTTLISWPLRHVIELSNIIMLFLLAVVLLALKLGRGPAVFAAFLSVATFDVFFVPPHFSFAVSDIQYLFTFIVMLVVALIIGQLTAGLRFQARIATHREERARTLFELARDLSGVLQKERIVEISTKIIEKSFNARVALIIPDEHNQLQILTPHTLPSGLDQTIAQWTLEKGEMAGCATNTLPSNPYRYLPLRAPMRIRGVLAITLNQPRWFLIPEQQRQLDTFCSLIAIALERVHYVDVAQNALIRMESERLRNSLLAAISHDLRTPLTALIGLSDTLNVAQPPLSQEHTVLTEAIREEAIRMNMLVNNLLDMARLQSGEIHLKREWHSIEEVIGTALHSLRRLLNTRTITVQLVPSLPLIEFDAVLIERVLVNVLENAAKYTPAHSPIRIEVQVIDAFLQVSIIDQGSGLPSGWEESIFEKFTRVEAESAIPGVGLGLAICRTIIESHQGKMWVRNLPEEGACFIFTLPAGHPPELIPYEETN